MKKRGGYGKATEFDVPNSRCPNRKPKPPTTKLRPARKGRVRKGKSRA